MTDTRDEGRTLYYSRCGWCGAYEGTVDPSEPCATDEEGYIGPHQFGVFERAPTSDTEDECICDGVQDWTCPIHGYDGSDTEDVGEEDATRLVQIASKLEAPWMHDGAEFRRDLAKDLRDIAARLRLARLRRTPETEEARIGRLLLDSVTPEAWGTLIGAVVDANDDIGGPLLERLNEIGRALATQDPNAGGEDE